MKDPIVEEVRKVRDALAAKHHYDIRKIIQDAKKREKDQSEKSIQRKNKRRAVV